MRRRGLLAGSGALAAPGAAWAQTRRERAVVGVIQPGETPAVAQQVAAFRRALADHGYVEGRNLRLEIRVRGADPEHIREIAAELSARGADVIVASGTTAVQATLAATVAIPVVLAGGADPVAMGFARNLARPGGRVTGLSILGEEFLAKRIEILTEIVPSARVLAALLQADNPGNPVFRSAIEEGARRLGREMHVIEVRAPSEFDAVFDRLAALQVGAMFVIEELLFATQASAIAEGALRRRIALMSGQSVLVRAGALASQNIDFEDLWIRAARFVARILDGAAPGDLPIEQPTKVQFFLNLKTAKALGIELAPSILARADEVIE